MDQQRIDAKKMYQELSFGKKLEHIWYYYKRSIIVTLLVLLLIGYAAYEVASRPKYDLEGTFFSDIYVSDEQIAALEEYLSQFVEDYNGDGAANIKIYSSSVAMLGNEVEGSMVVNTKFSTEMAAGADPFVIVDSTFHEILKQDAYELAIEDPQELTAMPGFREQMKIPEDTKVYWVTRALYSEEKEDPEKVDFHNYVVKTEQKIFESKK